MVNAAPPYLSRNKVHSFGAEMRKDLKWIISKIWGDLDVKCRDSGRDSCFQCFGVNEARPGRKDVKAEFGDSFYEAELILQGWVSFWVYSKVTHTHRTYYT